MVELEPFNAVGRHEAEIGLVPAQAFRADGATPGLPRPAGSRRGTGAAQANRAAQASSVAGVGSANCARTRPMSTARGNPGSSSDLRMAAVRAMSSSGASNGRRYHGPRRRPRGRRRPRPPARARHSCGRARPGWNRPRASYRKPAQFVRRRRPDRVPGRAGRLRPDPLEPSSRIALDYERRGGLKRSTTGAGQRKLVTRW